MIKKIKEYENDWAITIEQDRIHISQAKSGKNGYYCLGCDEEMQAVKPKKDIQPYFRHDATNVNRDKAKCVLASRTFREKIAKDYFFRTKKITLPAIYKFPDIPENGYPRLIKEKYTHHASKIIEELTFYEDEDGAIHFGSNPLIEERYNLIRPDLTFFNEQGDPTLLIEIVVTHKVDDEKKEKIRRLGIDCVQVIIPKRDVLEIEKYLSKSSSYKWLYNEIEANTKYVSFFGSDNEELPPIDEEQRKLLEESYVCRKSQLSNLIRSIEGCLRAESYRGVERHFKSEISRIETATDNLQREYSRQERGMEEEARRSISGAFDDIRVEQEQIRREQNTEVRSYSDLERRYRKRKREVSREQKDIDEQIFNYGIAISRERDYIQEHRTEGEVRADIARQKIKLEEEYNLLEEREREAIDRIQQNILQPRTRAISRAKTSIENEKRSIQSYSSRRARIIEKREGMEAEKEDYSNSAGSRIDRLQKQIIERVNERDISGVDELSERIRAVLQIRRLCRDFEDRRNLEQKLRRIKE